MKTRLAIILAIIFLAPIFGQAAGITNYFTQGWIIAGTNTDVGTTGLATGRLYVAIGVNETTNTDYTAVMMTYAVESFMANLSRFMEAQLAVTPITDFDIETSTVYTPTTSNVMYKTTNRNMTEDVTKLLTDP